MIAVGSFVGLICGRCEVPFEPGEFIRRSPRTMAWCHAACVANTHWINPWRRPPPEAFWKSHREICARTLQQARKAGGLT